MPAGGNPPVAPGFTDGPDLTSCFYTKGQEGAVFVFDRRQNSAKADVTDFGLVNPDGSFITAAPGTAAIPLQDDVALQIQFSPAQTADAIGCFVRDIGASGDSGAYDYQNQRNNGENGPIPKNAESNAVAANQSPTPPGGTAGATTGDDRHDRHDRHVRHVRDDRTTGTTGTTGVSRACTRARRSVRRYRRAVRRRKAALRRARRSGNTVRTQRAQRKLRSAKRKLRRAKRRRAARC